MFRLIDAVHLAHPPPHRPSDGDRHPDPRAMDAAFGAALTDLVGPDAAALRVPVAELAHLLRLLTLSGTHPRLCDGAPLTAEQVVSTLLDGLLRHRGDLPC